MKQAEPKITQITRYGTVLLATIQGYGLAVGLESSADLVINPGVFFKISTVTTIVAGTIFLMWLGEQITQRGIGNGISLIIFAGIVAEIPRALVTTFEPWKNWSSINYNVNRNFCSVNFNNSFYCFYGESA